MPFNVKLDDLIAPSRTIAPRSVKAPVVDRYAAHLAAVDAWPFPPLLVTKQIKKGKPTGKYVVLGGGHRIAAAEQVKWSHTIPATETKPKTIEDAYVAALKDNLSHGLPYSDGERDRSFVKLAGMWYNQTQIADIWRVNKSTVSRVLAGKQTENTKEKKARGGKAKAAKKKNGATNGDATGAQDVVHILDSLIERADDVSAFLTQPTDDETPAKLRAYIQTALLALRRLIAKVDAG